MRGAAVVIDGRDQTGMVELESEVEESKRNAPIGTVLVRLEDSTTLHV